MAVFQPPPTWADPILIDERTKKSGFNPVWLKWFIDLVGIINASGGGSGVIAHNSTTGLQGGQANQFYHNTAAENALVVALGTLSSQAANNVAITGGTIDGTVIGATTPAAAKFTSLGAAGTLRPATDAGAAQTACSIYAGTGAPNNANGANGDYYFRSDGGVATHIYFKAAGAWAGII